MKCKRTTDGRKHCRAVLPVMRQQAIKAIREGQDVNTVAAAYGVNVRSVFRWLAATETAVFAYATEQPAHG